MRLTSFLKTFIYSSCFAIKMFLVRLFYFLRCMALEIYALKIPERVCSQKFERLLSCLSPDKYKRIISNKREKDALRSLLADIIVRKIVSDLYNVKIKDIKYHYNSYGKPFLAMDVDFSFNISHSGNWVVVAIGYSQQIGIDIEEIHPIELDIAERFFSNDEYKSIMCQEKDERLGLFYEFWTLKESFIKAIGLGMRIPLNSFTFIKNKQNSYSIIQYYSNLSFFFKQYDLDPSYKVSVCATVDSFPSAISRCDFNELYNEICK